ncbi:hypothetical protein R4Z09_00855 [Niallia oryzisoli]|uniref:Uncharacterized protein n=1 Tax=Niallia oryzisoli TaxID=1737571 RepID=A0ABZ2CGH8_9BACI
MNVKKKEIRVRLRDENHEYLEEYKVEHGISTLGASIDNIIDQYKILNKRMFDLTVISKLVAHEVKGGMQNELKKMLLAINHTDYNTQVLIELLQGFIVADNKETLTTTDLFKPPFLNEAEQAVKQKIEAQKIKNHSK